MGTVTSVGLSAPGIFTVVGSPVTTSGTLALTLTNEVANSVWAGPTSGGAAAPTFRALVAADIPNIYVLKAGDMMTGALTLPTGAAGTPSLLGATATSGIFFPGAVTAFSVSGTEAFRTNTLGITVGTTTTQACAGYFKQDSNNFTGVLLKGTGTEWALNFPTNDFSIGLNGNNGNIYIDAASRSLSLQPGNGGAGTGVGYGVEAAYSSTSAAPTTLAAIVAKSGLQPGIYARSRNTTTGILNGFWSVGSSDRVMAGFYGVATTQTTNAEVSYAAIATQNAGTLTEAARFDNVGNFTTPGAHNTGVPQTTLTGSAGTAVCSQPSQGTSYKKVVVYLNGLTDTNTQIYTFPTAFTQTPYVYGTAGGVSGATVTTTTIRFTTTLQSGFVFVEGF